MFYRNSCVNANSVDSDQKPGSVVSDLCLHCLPMSNYETTSQVFKYIKSDPAIVNAMNKPCAIARYSCIFSKIVLLSNA